MAESNDNQQIHSQPDESNDTGASNTEIQSSQNAACASLVPSTTLTVSAVEDKSKVVSLNMPGPPAAPVFSGTNTVSIQYNYNSDVYQNCDISRPAGGSHQEENKESDTLSLKELAGVGKQIISKADNIEKKLNDIENQNSHLKRKVSDIDDCTKETAQSVKKIKESQDTIEGEVEMNTTRAVLTLQESRKTKKKVEEINEKLDETAQEVMNVSASLKINEQETKVLKEEMKIETGDIKEKIHDVHQDVKEYSRKLDALSPSIGCIRNPILQLKARDLMDYMMVGEMLPHLYSNYTITFDEMERIQAGEITSDKVLRLLIIMDKKPDGVEELKKVLVATDQEHVASMLDNNL